MYLLSNINTYIYMLRDIYIYWDLYIYIQPVPAKMRLEMGNEMQIEILNGGEILVN